MKVVVTSLGETLESPIDQRFERARFLLVYDCATTAWSVHDNKQRSPAAPTPGLEARQRMRALGADAVITGHCGPEAFAALTAAGIAVYQEATGTAIEALHALEEGTLKRSEPSDSSFGRTENPSAHGKIRGPCGDSMEFYLTIRDGVITDAKYYTEGCGNTRSCGRAVATRVQGKSVMEALSLAPRQIIDSGEWEPEAGRHCAILAVSTLYRALADYLLKS
jgi:predicted Fe-Mo cluster-binding NifX family protein